MVCSPGKKGVYESKCQRPTELKILLYLYCSRLCRTSHACTSVQRREYLLPYVVLPHVKCTEFGTLSSRKIIAFGGGLISYGYSYGIVCWCRTQTHTYAHFMLRIIYCIMLVVLMRITKKGVYCYCYWTNNFSFPPLMTMVDDDGWRTIAAREINAHCVRVTVKTSDLKSYFFFYFIWDHPIPCSLFTSNGIRDYSSFLFIDFNFTKRMYIVYFHLMSP